MPLLYYVLPPQTCTISLARRRMEEAQPLVGNSKESDEDGLEDGLDEAGRPHVFLGGEC
jgi:hypothetical protein